MCWWPFAGFCDGEIYVSDRMASKMLQQYVGGASPKAGRRSPNLTDRELEVFRLIGEGHATRQIAEELHISVKTVESYQAHIKEKLSLKNATRAGAARHCSGH